MADRRPSPRRARPGSATRRPRSPASRVDEVTRVLADDIVSGRLPPGVKLDEQMLADRFRTSRTPIREALGQLAVGGLVDKRPRRGAVVTKPTVGQPTITLRGETVPTRPNLGLFTQPVSCIGLPVAAVPIACGTRLPIGIQVIAAPWREDLCLRVAAALESAGLARAEPPPL